MESIVKQLDRSNADYIHFDVMDGDFVPNLTFGPQFIANIRKYSNKVFDVHLMINRVETFLDEYVKSGSDIITFHLEIDENINNIIEKVRGHGVKCGLAIKPKTPWEKIEPYLKSIDQVIIMTVEPGFGGQSFMNDQINKIENISSYIKSHGLNLNIEIDGGINYETGKLCTDAGANILVAGSFLFKQENLIEATNQLYDFFN
jgi:ribulose-phosphate 3-epimerase